MNLELHNIVTLDNQKKFAVMEKDIIDGFLYYYMLRVNEQEDGILDETVFMKEINEQGNWLLVQILDPDELERVMLFFTNKLNK